MLLSTFIILHGCRKLFTIWGYALKPLIVIIGDSSIIVPNERHYLSKADSLIKPNMAACKKKTETLLIPQWNPVSPSLL